MKEHVIYSIDCKKNGKCYIGRTSDPKRRQQDHFCALRGGRHRNAHLQSAFNKYGESLFSWKVMMVCNSEQEAKENEQWFLRKMWEFDCLFNLSKSSDGGGYKGRIVSDETKLRMSAAAKRTFSNPEARRRLSESRKGFKMSDEQKAKLSAIHKGKVLTKEHKKKMSEAQKRAWITRKLKAKK
jgi:group I intron endonuclease